MEDDTVKLLRECSSGCKMAADSISHTRSKINHGPLKKLLDVYYDAHTALYDRCQKMLASCGEPDKDTKAFAKIMANMKTDVEFAFDDTPSTAAKLMLDGCNMGIKSIGRYLNQYKAASKESKEIAGEVLQCEKRFADELIPFL